MSSPIALGYADSVTLAAGQLLRVTGGGFITHGNPTRQSLFRGAAVFGPFEAVQVIYITASQSPVSYGTYSAEGAWLGSFASLAELQGAFPSPAIGDYATLIDGSDVPTIYRFGTSGWVASAGGGGGGDVSSVNGKTGTVVLNKADLSLGNVDNTADSAKPVSTAQAAAIASAAASGPVSSVAGKTGAVTLAVADVSGAAPLASPTFTGSPTVPGYAPLASPALTGTPTAPTAAAGTNTTQVATMAAIINERTAAATLTNKTLTAPTLSGTVAGTYTLGGTPTFPSSVVQTTATQTLTNKTLTAPTVNGQSGTLTNTSTTSGIQTPGWGQTYTYNPGSAPTGAITFTSWDEYLYASSQTNGSGGHSVASMSFLRRTGTGDPSLSISHEAKYENQNSSGTHNTHFLYQGQLSRNDSTVTQLVGMGLEVTGNAGTVANMIGTRTYVSANTGAIGTLIGNTINIATGMAGSITQILGYWFQDMFAAHGYGIRRFLVNDDAYAPGTTQSSLIEQNWDVAVPTASGTFTAGPYRRGVVLNHTTTVTPYTIVLPTLALLDKQIYSGRTRSAITSLSFTGSGTTYNAPTSLTAGARFDAVYNAATAAWYF